MVKVDSHVCIYYFLDCQLFVLHQKHIKLQWSRYILLLRVSVPFKDKQYNEFNFISNTVPIIKSIMVKLHKYLSILQFRRSKVIHYFFDKRAICNCKEKKGNNTVYHGKVKNSCRSMCYFIFKPGSGPPESTSMS